MPGAPVEPRIGDRERRVVDDRLQAAVGEGALTLAEYDQRAAVLWRSRTRSELDALVADLPAADSAAPAASTGEQPVRRRSATAATARFRSLRRRASALLVPATVAGAVLLAGPDSASLFGSSLERVQPGDRSVEVSVLFGSVSVVVPDDARVDTDGLIVFGSISCTEACDADGSGDVVDVRGVGGFGSVVVYTQSEHAELTSAGTSED